MLVSLAAQSSPVQWNTGDALTKALGGRITGYRATGPLLPTLLNLSQQRGVAVYLDRRVDPGQELDIELNNQTVEEILFLIADEANLGVCRLGDVFYVGPRDQVAHLQLLREQALESLGDADEATRSGLLRKRPLTWPRLSEPDRIVKQLAEETNLQLEYRQFPHDLWPEYEFPAMTLLDRLTLLSFGFAQAIDVPGSEGSRVSLQPVPAPESGDHVLRVGAPPDKLEQLRRAFPELNIERTREGLALAGTPLQVYNVARWVAVNHRSSLFQPHPAATKVVSLKTTASIGGILASVAKQLEVPLQFDPSLRAVLEKRVTIDQQRVSYEKLIEAALASTDLTYELTPESLKITPR